MGSRIPLAALVQTLAVAEHLNFRHAAKALGISQSSVSARIKALEEELGVALFERRHRGVKLTKAGQRFVEEIGIGMSYFDHAVKTAGAISRGEEGRLLLGFNSLMAVGRLADLHRHYREAFPAVEVVLAEGTAPKLVRQVLEGSLDLAIVFGRPNVPGCHCKMLWTEALVVALSASHALAFRERVLWSDLSSETFLVRYDGAGPELHHHIVRRMTERGLTPIIERREVGRDTLSRMIADRDGIALMYESARHADYAGVRFILIEDEIEPIHHYAIWSPHNSNPALRRFITIATNLIRKDAIKKTAAPVAPLQNPDRSK